MATNGNFSQQDQYKTGAESYPATSGPAESTSGGAASGQDLSKDEVGWYFVEQYYTTLSKNPEKLHLFYGKRSQFVSGQEAEVSSVSVGRGAIQERIKQLDFQDCKVRVSNVDSQASYENIVIQVIGETSNKSADLKKFVQTFVLAQQPTGYFVLNDIFRYINEEGEEEPVESSQEDSAAATTLVEDVEMPKAQPAAEDPVVPAVPALDTEVVDKKLEETVEQQDAMEETPATNGTPEAEEASASAPEVESVPEPEVAAKEVQEEIKEPEKPKEPVPSPAVTRATSTTKVPTPSQPAAPAKPLSWASRAAAAVGTAPKPAVPVVAPKTATPPAQTRAPPAQAAKPTPSTTQTTATQGEKDKENAPQGSGWQTAGSDTKRQNRPQSISSPPEKEGTMGYVRNVTEKVTTEELKSALALHGQLIYFDINRTKNCAFVEYATPEGYQASAAANPHQVCGEAIYVEPRRPKAGAYGGNGYPGGRGGLNQRGRGGFPNRGRSGSGQGAPRGRGNGQPTNA